MKSMAVSFSAEQVVAVRHKRSHFEVKKHVGCKSELPILATIEGNLLEMAHLYGRINQPPPLKLYH